MLPFRSGTLPARNKMAYSSPQPFETPCERATCIRWKIFFVLFLLVVVNMVDRATISIALPMISKELSLSATMQGLVLSSFFWTYALMQVPSGLIADKFGARVTVSASTVLWGASQALLGLCTGGLSLIFARLALGASEAPIFPAGARLNVSWLNKFERARGAVLMDAGGPFGAALGGILVAQMILMFDSWRITFIIAGIVTVLLGFAAYWIIRDEPHHDPMVNKAELAIIDKGREKTEKAAQADTRPILEVIKPISLGSILIGRCAWAMLFFGLLTWGPSYLSHALDMDLKTVGWATLVIFCCGGFGSICGGVLADKLTSKGWTRAKASKVLLTISGLCTLAAFAALPNMTSVNACVGLLSISSFVLMWGSMYWSFPPLLAPKNRVATVGGMMNMAGAVGGICIPLLIGVILDLTNHSYDPVLYFFAACSLVFVIMTNLIDLSRAK